MINEINVKNIAEQIKVPAGSSRKHVWEKLLMLTSEHARVPAGSSRKHVWEKLLMLTSEHARINTDDIIIGRAILAAIGQFNFWEEDDKIAWPENVHSVNWFDYVVGKTPPPELNLPDLRNYFYKAGECFINEHDAVEGIHDQKWWDLLHILYGCDPLKKRETLLWIMLTDLGYKNMPCPNKGCIDYNIITAFRFFQIIEGYEGNTFDIDEETKIRFDCLKAVEMILELRPDLTICTLDDALYNMGKMVRRGCTNWEDFFCYRIGCYYY